VALKVYYLPEYISEDEEKAMLEQTYAVPSSHAKWVNLRVGRILEFFSSL
jgi:hypothetical protein